MAATGTIKGTPLNPVQHFLSDMVYGYALRYPAGAEVDRTLLARAFEAVVQDPVLMRRLNIMDHCLYPSTTPPTVSLHPETLTRPFIQNPNGFLLDSELKAFMPKPLQPSAEKHYPLLAIKITQDATGQVLVGINASHVLDHGAVKEVVNRAIEAMTKSSTALSDSKAAEGATKALAPEHAAFASAHRHSAFSAADPTYQTGNTLSTVAHGVTVVGTSLLAADELQIQFSRAALQTKLNQYKQGNTTLQRCSVNDFLMALYAEATGASKIRNVVDMRRKVDCAGAFPMSCLMGSADAEMKSEATETEPRLIAFMVANRQAIDDYTVDQYARHSQNIAKVVAEGRVTAFGLQSLGRQEATISSWSLHDKELAINSHMPHQQRVLGMSTISAKGQSDGPMPHHSVIVAGSREAPALVARFTPHELTKMQAIAAEIGISVSVSSPYHTTPIRSVSDLSYKAQTAAWISEHPHVTAAVGAATAAVICSATVRDLLAGAAETVIDATKAAL